jgi:DNA-binding MarR family transcriptional regulator
MQAPARRKTRPTCDIRDILPLYDTGGPSYIGYRIVLTAKLFDRCIARLLDQISDLSLPQWRVLGQLGRLPSGTVRSLASGAAVDRSEVSRALRELEQLGLVERRQNPQDLRSPDFALTSAGRTTFERIRKPMSVFISGLVATVDPADLDAANRVLWAVTNGCLGSI